MSKRPLPPDLVQHDRLRVHLVGNDHLVASVPPPLLPFPAFIPPLPLPPATYPVSLLTFPLLSTQFPSCPTIYESLLPAQGFYPSSPPVPTTALMCKPRATAHLHAAFPEKVASAQGVFQGYEVVDVMGFPLARSVLATPEHEQAIAIHRTSAAYIDIFATRPKSAGRTRASSRWWKTEGSLLRMSPWLLHMVVNLGGSRRLTCAECFKKTSSNTACVLCGVPLCQGPCGDLFHSSPRLALMMEE
jgi:hypothetical protein